MWSSDVSGILAVFLAWLGCLLAVLGFAVWMVARAWTAPLFHVPAPKEKAQVCDGTENCSGCLAKGPSGQQWDADMRVREAVLLPSVDWPSLRVSAPSAPLPPIPLVQDHPGSPHQGKGGSTPSQV